MMYVIFISLFDIHSRSRSAPPVVDPLAVWRRRELVKVKASTGLVKSTTASPPSTIELPSVRQLHDGRDAEYSPVIDISRELTTTPIVDPFAIFRRSLAVPCKIQDPVGSTTVKKARPPRSEVKRSLLLPEILDADRQRRCGCEGQHCPSKISEGMMDLLIP